MAEIEAHILRDGRGQYYAVVRGTLRRVTELEFGKFTDASKKLTKAEKKKAKRARR